jgi:hypothetical protein
VVVSQFGADQVNSIGQAVDQVGKRDAQSIVLCHDISPLIPSETLPQRTYRLVPSIPPLETFASTRMKKLLQRYSDLIWVKVLRVVS